MRRWDRKQAGFFILLAAFLLFSVSVITALAQSQGSHAVLGEEQGYRQALYVAVSTQQVPDGAELTKRSRERLGRGLEHIPGERRTAHFFFPNGMKAVDVASFLGKTKADLYIFTAVLAGTSGRKVMGLQESTVGRQTGSIAARIESAVREELRNERIKPAQAPIDSPYEVIEIGVVASNTELNKLARQHGDFVFSYRTSALMASMVDARLACFASGSACNTAIHDVVPQAAVVGEPAKMMVGPYLRTQDDAEIFAAFANHRRKLDEVASSTPRQRRVATVFFTEAVDGWTLESELAPRSLEVLSVEALFFLKGWTPDLHPDIPRDRPIYHRSTLNTQDLRYGESIEERVDIAWGKVRARSRNPTVQAIGNNVILRAEVVGTYEFLQSLAHSSRVLGVIVDEEKKVDQRADADDPTPELGMKRLAIPGEPAIPQVGVYSQQGASMSNDLLRERSRDTPEERSRATLLLRGPVAAKEAQDMLVNYRVQFRDEGAILAILGEGRPESRPASEFKSDSALRVLSLDVEARLIDLYVLSQDSRVFKVLLR